MLRQGATVVLVVVLLIGLFNFLSPISVTIEYDEESVSVSGSTSGSSSAVVAVSKAEAARLQKEGRATLVVDATESPEVAADKARQVAADKAWSNVATSTKGRPVLVMYMSHSPSDDATPAYASAVFVYTALYAQAHRYKYAHCPFFLFTHPHTHPSLRRFVYYVAPEKVPAQPTAKGLPVDCHVKKYCRHGEFGCHQRSCVGPDGCLLHPVWCKVKAVLTALRTNPEAPFVLSMDTDSVVTFEFFTRPLEDWVHEKMKANGETFAESPLVLNKDQPTWWQVAVRDHNTTKTKFNVDYQWVINTGNYLVGNNAKGRGVMETWWNSSLGDYAKNPLDFKYRSAWPWEQDRAMALLNEFKTPGIQVFPDKHGKVQRDWMETRHTPGWCFSATPAFRCMLNHFCNNAEMKIHWGNRTMGVAMAILHTCSTGKDTEVRLAAGGTDGDAPFAKSLTITQAEYCSDYAKQIPYTFGEYPAATHKPANDPDRDYWGNNLRLAARYFAERHVVELP